MSNVLPTEARKSAWAVYRTRFIIVGSLMFTCAAVFAALALAPSYAVLMLQRMGGSPHQIGTAASTQDRTDIAHTQSLIRAFSAISATSSPSVFISEALSVRPTGVSIDHITATAGQPGTIILSGGAAQIDAISTYQSALRAAGKFSSVSVPVGDLAGTADGTFSITLSANF